MSLALGKIRPVQPGSEAAGGGAALHLVDARMRGCVDVLMIWLCPQAPTAIAYDTAATYRGNQNTRWRMLDMYRGRESPRGDKVDMAMLKSFVALIAKQQTKAATRLA